jgi:ABC-type taurine transport system ATPase subunit
MAEVVLDKVNKKYDNGFHAVRDLDLDIADGEFLVLVGPSGCGKSTASCTSRVNAPKVVTEDTKELERDAHTEDVPIAHHGTSFVASFAPRSRVRAGDDVEIVVDRERMQFFDPETGLAIRG